jgi:hypothetical protein
MDDFNIVSVEHRPHPVLFSDFDCRLVDVDHLSILAVNIEQMPSSKPPLSAHLVGTIDYQFDRGIRQPSMIQDPTVARRPVGVSSWENIFS